MLVTLPGIEIAGRVLKELIVDVIVHYGDETDHYEPGDAEQDDIENEKKGLAEYGMWWRHD